MPLDHPLSSDSTPWDKLIGYFDQQVLAAYRNEPDKWILETDLFEGHLRITNDYYELLEASASNEDSVDIQFGYRTLDTGELAVAAWLPDLFDKSPGHVQRWTGFHLRDVRWSEPDERFRLWVRRYMEGDWDVENGARSQLGEIIGTIRGLTAETVGIPLFRYELSATLHFPAAENTHRYQDAHRELYGYLVDGLDKHSIEAIATKLSRNVNVRSGRSVAALKQLLPSLDESSVWAAAIELVSEQRRCAAHGVREPAVRFPAFWQFTSDLELCVAGMKELLSILENEFGVSGERANERYRARRYLPKIDRPSQSNFSICQAVELAGKTVTRVEFGFRKDVEGLHESEVLILHFTDGSILGIDTGSNAVNVAMEHKGVRPEDFHANFHLQWVPPLV